MNLSEHFEPLEPPVDGLRQVRRTARRRAVVRRLSKGSALLVFVFMISGPLIASNWFTPQGAELQVSNAPSVASGDFPGLAIRDDHHQQWLLTLLLGMSIMI